MVDMIDKIGCFGKLLSMMRKSLGFRPFSFLNASLWLLLPVLVLSLGCQQSETRGNRHKESEKRYVVLSPELAEIIALIEGTDNIVGRTEECNYPESISAKPVVGKFGALNREKIINLKPTLVFASSLEQQAIGAELQKLGIKVVTVYPKSIQEMLEAVRTVGKAISQVQRAAYVADSLSTELAELQKNIPAGNRPKVYVEIYSEPMMSVSDQSFVGSLVETAGGDNIFSELERDYSRINAEEVIKANPDIVLCYSQLRQQDVVKRLGWQNIPAVRTNKIYFEKDLNPDWIMRAGPRCLLGIRRLQEIMFGSKRLPFKRYADSENQYA